MKTIFTFLFSSLCFYGLCQSEGYDIDKTQLANNYVLVTVTGPVNNYATYLCKGNLNEIKIDGFENGYLLVDQNDRDHLEENIDLGLLPSDIEYFKQNSENMLVCGGNKLRILDGDTHANKIIDFDLDTKVSLHNMAFMPISPNRNQIIENKITVDGKDRFFIIYAGEGGGLKVIESEGDDVFNFYQDFKDDIEKSQLLSSSVYGYCNAWFYWVLNYWDGTCKVKRYIWNINENKYSFDKQLLLQGNEIIDFQTQLISEGPLKLALLYSVLVIEPITLEITTTYNNLSIDKFEHNYGHKKGQHEIYNFEDENSYYNIDIVTMATNGCYDWVNNRAYFTGYCDKETGQPDFRVINYKFDGINSFFKFSELEGAMDVKYYSDNPEIAHLIAVGNNQIIGFDNNGEKNCPPEEPYSDLHCHYGYRIAFDNNPSGPLDDRIGISVACLIDGLLVQRRGFDCNSIPLTKIVETGISSSITCFNEQNENAYFFYNGDGGSNYFIKYNGNNTELVTIDPNNPQSFSVTDCIYNDESELILASLNDKCVDDFKLLKIVNGGNPNVLSESYENISCFANYDDFIYFYSKTSGHRIDKVSMNGTAFQHDVISVTYAVNSLDINKEDHCIYGTCVSPDGIVVKIDHLNINNVTYYQIEGNNPVDISYLTGLDKIYIAQYNDNYNRIEVYNTNFGNPITIINLNDHPKKIEYNPYQKQAYIVSDVTDEPGLMKIIIIDCVEDQVLEEKLIRRSNGYIYDTINDQIYFHTNFPDENDNGEFEYNIKSLNGFDNEFSNQVNTSLNTYSDILMSKERIVPSKPSYNYEDNYIYFGNYGSATATKIKAYDEFLTFKPGWKWLSLPRMERYLNEPFNAITLLERINPWPADYLKLIYEPTGITQFIEYINENWNIQSNLISIKSSQGYKLNYLKSGIQNCSIRIEGAKLDYETLIDLTTGDNWVGYYIDKPMYPEECLPTNLWNVLTQIRTQYWSMTKVLIGPGGTGYWFIKGDKQPFHYGDLVILKTSQPYNLFQWQHTGAIAVNHEIPVTSYYTFEEQSDYLPFYIETDSSSGIMEIAVLADGVVKGASIREPGDTIVEVKGYLEGVAPDALIEFETWEGTKSEPVEKSYYLVIDHSRNVREKRNIYAGEKAYYYHVSLKSNEVFDLPPEIGIVTCQPNPFGNNTTFTFRINEKSNITLRIFDLQGNIVKTLIDGYYSEGYYNLTWNGDNESGNRIPPGVYFYKVSTGNKPLQTDKIVLIK